MWISLVKQKFKMSVCQMKIYTMKHRQETGKIIVTY